MSPFSLWTSAEIAAATHGDVNLDFVASGVSIDSRTVGYGDLFVALKGPNFDGHDYVAQAIGKGAVGALVSQVPAGIEASAPLVIVDDTLIGLERLGRTARHRVSAQVAAVTGSVGKTSTKEALSACLADQGATHASVGSFNNHWGVPLTLARMPTDCDFAVFEIGMNHAGEITPLVKMVEPQVTLITNVEAVHLENFPDETAIAEAKAEIFDGLRPGGVAVLNRDNRWFDYLARRAQEKGVARVVGFGSDPRAEARVTAQDCRADGSTVAAVIDGEALDFTLSTPGPHWVTNALGVLAAIKMLGGNVARAGESLGRIAPPKGRGRRHVVELPQGGSIVLIDDSYNASPPSMRAGFATLAALPVGAGGRRIAVLGDMLELGPDELALHASLARDIEAARLDLVFTAGRRMHALRDALPATRRADAADNADALAATLIAALKAGDVVMVKGSRGSRMDKVVDALTTARTGRA